MNGKNICIIVLFIWTVTLFYECAVLEKKVDSLEATLSSMDKELSTEREHFKEFYEKSYCRLYMSVGESYRHLRRHERWLKSKVPYPDEKVKWGFADLPYASEKNGEDPARRYRDAHMYGFPEYEHQEPKPDGQKKDAEAGLTPRSWFTVQGKSEPKRVDTKNIKPKKKFSGKMNIMNVGLETEEPTKGKQQ